MSQKTKIQWCDSTINPTMGCSGCELFPSPARVIEEIDAAVSALLKSTETSLPPHASSEGNRRALAIPTRPNEY
jgi:hypothetical protein